MLRADTGDATRHGAAARGVDFIELIYQRRANEVSAHDAALEKRNRVFAADQSGAVAKVGDVLVIGKVGDACPACRIVDAATAINLAFGGVPLKSANALPDPTVAV